MSNQFLQCFFKSLKVFATLAMVGIIALLLIVNFEATPLRQVKVDAPAVDGKIQISRDWQQEAPIFMNGEWEYYPNVYFDENKPIDPTLLRNPKLVHLPITKLHQAEGTGTYRLLLKADLKKTKEKLSLYIPDVRSPIKVFLNGVLQENQESTDPWIGLKNFFSIVPLDPFDAQLEYQELIFSVNKNPCDTALYQRCVIFGTLGSVTALASITLSNDMLFWGVVLLLMLNGFIFMCFRPQHLLISCITLFDTMIILRLIFGIRGIFSFLNSFFPTLSFSDRFCFSMSLLFLMLGGMAGSYLSHILFDPEGDVSRWLTAIPMAGYGIFAIIFPLFPKLFETEGIPLLLCLYALTFVGIFLQCCVCWKKRRSAYYIFQMIKTAFLGGVILFDILHFNCTEDLLNLITLYCIVFLIHLVQRVYDSNNSYEAVEILNRTLESTVETRTKQLSEANQILSEMTIRDPLTKAYNRLHLEHVMEQYLSQTEKEHNMHLSMFDLDHFKNINDHYGHEAGDRQLRALVEMVSSRIDEDSILARVGGEEFVLLFFDQSEETAKTKLEGIRQAIEAAARENPRFTTASFGFTSYQPGDTMKTLLTRADLCLYEAKNNGRNRIVTSNNLSSLQSKGVSNFATKGGMR